MKVIKSYNPASLELIDEVKSIETVEIPKIIHNAKIAQAKWKKIPLNERIKLLKKLLQYLSDNIEVIAKIIHLETGKPKIEAINSDIIAGMGSLKFSIDTVKKVLKPYKIKFRKMRIPLWFLGRSSYIYPEPLGVIGIISPWNFPFGIPFSQVVMAIASGNAVILKPSSETVLTGLKIEEILDEVGFPENLIQVIPGSGSIVGSALVKSNLDRIIFTGSDSVGKEIMRMASQRLTPITLELGGKSPMIILKDADIKKTVRGAVWGSFLNSGQVCSGVKRIYVQEEIYDEFLNKFKKRVKNLKQGFNWEDPEISIGPLINEEALKKMEQHIKIAVNQGAKILTGGKRTPNLEGYFFEPTILIDVQQHIDVVHDEIFGPIVVVIPFTTEEEAIALANDTKFGLYGSIWTRNIKRGKKIAKQLTMGTVAINNHTYTYGLPQTPWGGNKNSGFGRTHGSFGFNELLEPHHLHVDNGRFKEDLWWHPYDKEKLLAQADIKDVLFLKKYRKMIPLIRRLFK